MYQQQQLLTLGILALSSLAPSGAQAASDGGGGGVIRPKTYTEGDVHWYACVSCLAFAQEDPAHARSLKGGLKACREGVSDENRRRAWASVRHSADARVALAVARGGLCSDEMADFYRSRWGDDEYVAPETARGKYYGELANGYMPFGRETAEAVRLWWGFGGDGDDRKDPPFAAPKPSDTIPRPEYTPGDKEWYACVTCLYEAGGADYELADGLARCQAEAEGGRRFCSRENADFYQTRWLDRYRAPAAARGLYALEFENHMGRKADYEKIRSLFHPEAEEIS